jgi:predicted RNase H-like nuclease (RuvC/YqgF family)
MQVLQSTGASHVDFQDDLENAVAVGIEVEALRRRNRELEIALRNAKDTIAKLRATCGLMRNLLDEVS